MSQVSYDPTMCNYCHQRPKFPPYEYCGKTCGTRAAAIKGQGSAAPAPVMCKNCNQRPVFQGHEFCGRKCANAWTGTRGENNSLGYFGILVSPPWNQNQEGGRGSGQPERKQGRLQEFFRSLFSPTNNSQQQERALTNTARPQQRSPNIANRRSFMIPASSPATQSATLNQRRLNKSRSFHEARPVSFLPIGPPSSRGSTSDIDTDATKTGAVGSRANPSSGSAKGVTHASEHDDANPDATDQVVAPERDPEYDGDGEGDQDDPFAGGVVAQHAGSVLPTVCVNVCKLEGCSRPTFIDSITDLESEYCSWEHQKEAMGSK